MNKLVFFLTLLFGSSMISSQTVNDESFSYEIKDPMYKKDQGPTLFIDAAHNNRHTKHTGFSSLSKMLESDGFVVMENKSPFTQELLSKMDILIIVNPLHDSNIKNWKLPCPSAFTQEEITVVENWVANGGRLFLSADHMPYGGAVQDLAKAFGVTWSNSFDRTLKKRWPPAEFSRDKETLRSSPVTDSSSFAFEIDYIGTFTGSAFKSSEAIPFLVFDSDYELLLPEVAWKFNKKTDRLDASGWFQGACIEYGKGKWSLWVSQQCLQRN